MRLWRIQRNIDADVDALPEAQQANLGDVLVRADADSRDAIRRMDQDALDDFTGLDVDPRVRAGLAQKYADLDADQRRQLTNAISDDPAAARTVSTLDSERELDDGTEARQMEDEWISDSFDEEIEDGSFEDYSAVEDAIDLQNYEKEVIVVQDGAASRSIVGSFDDFDIDDVTIVRTQGVTGEGP